MSYIPSFNANEIEVLLVGGGGAGGPIYFRTGEYGSGAGGLGAGGGGGGGEVLTTRLVLTGTDIGIVQVGHGGYRLIGTGTQFTGMQGAPTSLQISSQNILLEAKGGGRGAGTDLFDSGEDTYPEPGFDGQDTSLALSARIAQMNGAAGGGGGVVISANLNKDVESGRGTSGGNGGTGERSGPTAYNGGGGGARGAGQYSPLTRKGDGGMGAPYHIGLVRPASGQLELVLAGGLIDYYSFPQYNVGVYGGGGASGNQGSFGGAGGGADAPLAQSSTNDGQPGMNGTGGGGSGGSVFDSFANGWANPGPGGNGIVIISYTGPQKLRLGTSWKTFFLGPFCAHCLEYNETDYNGTLILSSKTFFALDQQVII